MSDLIALSFNSRERAHEARAEFLKMQAEHLVELEDCAVVYKNEKGKLKIDQTVNLTAEGATSGAFWGLLLGLIFSLPFPFAGVLLPVWTTVFGAGFGALAASMTDYGISDDIMKSLALDLDERKAILFILNRKETNDKMMENLAKFKDDARLVKTSLSNELDEKLRRVLRAGEEVVPAM